MNLKQFKSSVFNNSISLYAWATYKRALPDKKIQPIFKTSFPVTLFMTFCLALMMVCLPSVALAQGGSGMGGALKGLTDILKEIANVLIYDWGYYIGIITLVVQGIRWKMGRINAMQLGGWALGIGLVFFAPNIVDSVKSKAGKSL